MEASGGPTEDPCLGRCCLRPGFWGAEHCRKEGSGGRVRQSHARVFVKCSAGCKIWFHQPDCYRAAMDLLKARLGSDWRWVRAPPFLRLTCRVTFAPNGMVADCCGVRI